MRRNEIERLLPGVFQATLAEGGPLAAILDLMEALHARPEAVLASLDGCFDPRRAPEAFVPFLARWVNLDLPVTTGAGRRRELVAAAVELSRWRGTARGLVLFLETATGRTGFQIDERVPYESKPSDESKPPNESKLPDKPKPPRPFHIRVTAPPDVAPHRAMLARIIEREKPAYVTYELVFA